MQLATAAQIKWLDEAAMREPGMGGTVLMERAAQGVARQVEGVYALQRGGQLRLDGEKRPQDPRALSAALHHAAGEDWTPQGEDGGGHVRCTHLPQATGTVCVGDEVYTVAQGRQGQPPCAVIFAGTGNNGGDGIAAARLLLERGWRVHCFLVGSREKMSRSCKAMERSLRQAGGVLEVWHPASARQRAWAMGADVIVDAICAVGLTAPLRGAAAQAAADINACPAPVVAVDLPSGVEADSGCVPGVAVQAAVTVTFTMAKPGLLVGKGAMQAGAVLVEDIGIPQRLIGRLPCATRTLERHEVGEMLPRRAADGHKGSFGKVLIVGGAVGTTGAPALAARAAMRTGAGLVTVLTPWQVYPIVAGHCLESMVRPLPQDYLEVLGMAERGDGLLIGPGMGQGPDIAGLAPLLLLRHPGTVILDADGINLMAAHMDILDGRSPGSTILTPHEGEFARLGGDLSGGDRLGQARAFARAHRCVLVLKGYHTIVAAPDGRCWVNTTGNAGMAKGGSGDVLAGMILALVGQGLSPVEAALCGVWLHGDSGDRVAEELGAYAMLPSDLVDRGLPQSLRALTREMGR